MAWTPDCGSGWNTRGGKLTFSARIIAQYGAGIKGGVSHGATDEFGRRSVENITNVWEFYGTVLKLLGFDHERLGFYYNGFDRKLTDVHGGVITGVLA